MDSVASGEMKARDVFRKDQSTIIEIKTYPLGPLHLSQSAVGRAKSSSKLQVDLIRYKLPMSSCVCWEV